MECAPAGPAPAMPDSASCPAHGPYLPRRPQASPLYRVLADHFAALERAHEKRF